MKTKLLGAALLLVAPPARGGGKDVLVAVGGRRTLSLGQAAAVSPMDVKRGY